MFPKTSAGKEICSRIDAELTAALKLYQNDPSTLIADNGDKFWTNSSGLLSRENDLPSIVRASGELFWYDNGKRHHSNGPAHIESNGKEFYWLYGVSYTKEDWEKEVKLNNEQ